MQRQSSEQLILDGPNPQMDEPSLGGKEEDSKILIFNFWDQPEVVWEKSKLASEAPASLAKFCQQLAKLEANFGESLVKLGQEYKDAPFSEGPTLLRAWQAFVQQIGIMGEEFGHIAKSTLLMSGSGSNSLLKKMESVLDEPVKLGKQELAAAKKQLLEQTKVFDKTEKEVEKMKEHENSKKLKKQKSSKQLRSPKALTNSKPVKVWTGEDAWIEGLSDRKVVIAEALMFEFKKARSNKNDCETKYKQTLTHVLTRYQNVDKERVHTLRDIMYGTLSTHNTSLTASYKCALVKMRKVKETSHHEDLQAFCSLNASQKPCPWVQHDARVSAKQAASVVPAVLEGKRMIAPKRLKENEHKSHSSGEPADKKTPTKITVTMSENKSSSTETKTQPITSVAAAAIDNKNSNSNQQDVSFGSQAYFANLAEVNKSATLTPMALWGRTHYLAAQAQFAKEYALEQQQQGSGGQQSKEVFEEDNNSHLTVDATKGRPAARSVIAPSRSPLEMPPLVIDNGSAYFKAGFAGEQTPSFVVSSSLAYYPHLWNSQNRAQFVGSSSLHTGPELLVSPSSVTVNSSVFNDDPNWDDVESAWEYLFSRLTPNPEEHYVLMTQPCLAPLKLKRTMEEILYEKFGIQGLYIAEAPLLSAYAYGQSSGLVVEVGHSSAQVVPIVDGYLLDAHVKRVKHLGGAQDTQRVLNYFRDNPDPQEADRYPTEAHLHAMAQSVKERLCSCPASKNAYEDESAVCEDVQGFLGGQDPENGAVKKPQGPHSITLHKALLMCGEVSFSPNDVLHDHDSSIVSIQQLCKDVVANCAVDVRNDLLANVFLSGQVTTMPGFEQRLRQELRSSISYAPIVNVFGSAKRYATWTGGSVLACIDDFKTEWRLRDEWEPEMMG